MLGHTDLLNPGECLVYVQRRTPHSETSGVTHIARILSTFTEDNRLWYKLQLLTDTEGDRIPDAAPITITGDAVLSNRTYTDITPRRMYHFGTVAGGTSAVQYPVTASYFVNTRRIEDPLSATTNTGLGSGIYGLHIENVGNIDQLKTNPDQQVYEISCPQAYILQDKEHGESLTSASMQTIRYVERILQGIADDDEATYDDILTLIQINSVQNLVTLWNIVLYRTGQRITREQLESLLAQYALDYMKDTSLHDSITGDVILVQPINPIMWFLGHDGILARDSFNNRWDRGCVSYNYEQAAIIKSDRAPYQ